MTPSFAPPGPTTFSSVPNGPAEDLALDLVFQQLVSEVIGMDGSLVRPRWQPAVPQQPEPGVDWCAIGVMSSTPDAYAYVAHYSGPGITDPAADVMIRHEELQVLASFYGPNSKSNAGLLRDGLQIMQNLQAIESVSIGFTDTEPMRLVPDFINQQWIRRVDMGLRFRRAVTRVYAVPNILDANVHLFDDSGHVNATIVVPPSGR